LCSDVGRERGDRKGDSDLVGLAGRLYQEELRPETTNREKINNPRPGQTADNGKENGHAAMDQGDPK